MERDKRTRKGKWQKDTCLTNLLNCIKGFWTSVWTILSDSYYTAVTKCSIVLTLNCECIVQLLQKMYLFFPGRGEMSWKCINNSPLLFLYLPGIAPQGVNKTRKSSAANIFLSSQLFYQFQMCTKIHLQMFHQAQNFSFDALQHHTILSHFAQTLLYFDSRLMNLTVQINPPLGSYHLNFHSCH